MGSRKTAAVINMTPMIDILLVLLITFMLLPDRTKGLPAEAPDPAPDTRHRRPRIRWMLCCGLRRTAPSTIDSQPVAAAELDARLRPLFAARPGGVLFIDGAPELEYADVASVIDMARGAGVNRVGLI